MPVLTVPLLWSLGQLFRKDLTVTCKYMSETIEESRKLFQQVIEILLGRLIILFNEPPKLEAYWSGKDEDKCGERIMAACQDKDFELRFS